MKRLGMKGEMERTRTMIIELLKEPLSPKFPYIHSFLLHTYFNVLILRKIFM